MSDFRARFLQAAKELEWSTEKQVELLCNYIDGHTLKNDTKPEQEKRCHNAIQDR